MPIDLNEHLKRKNANRRDDDNNTPKRKIDINPPNFNMHGSKTITSVVVIVAIVLLFVVAKPFVIINSGEVGIKVNLGDYQEKLLPAGLHFLIPGIQRMIIVDTRVKTIFFTSGEDASQKSNQSTLQKTPIQVKDKLGLDVGIELTLKYQLDSSKARYTIIKYTDLWDNNLIVPGIREVVGSVIGNYNAEELPSKRDEIANLITTNFANKINAIEDKPVRLESVELSKIILPQEVKTRIEQVQVAKQEANKAIEEANAVRERAKGKTDAVIIEAKGQAEANTLIGNSISNRLLELKQIEIQGKFNEALKENKDAQIFLTPGGTVPNIWIDSKNKQKSTITTQN